MITTSSVRPSPANSGIPTLTLGQRYALSAAVALARAPKGRFVPLPELAEAAQAPAPFLAKVLASLVAAGVLEGRKGHYGGYRLGRPARRIRLHDIVSTLATSDDPGDRNPCAMGARACSARKPCALHDAWAEALSGVRTFLRDTTLDTLVAASAETEAEVEGDAPSLPAAAPD